MHLTSLNMKGKEDYFMMIPTRAPEYLHKNAFIATATWNLEKLFTLILLCAF